MAVEIVAAAMPTFRAESAAVEHTPMLAIREQPNPIDERPKVNGEPTIDQSHELVIKKNNAQD